MSLANEIKYIRQKSYLSQTEFAEALNVSFGTVNRWENSKSKPNMTAMKTIRSFCVENDLNYKTVEEAWLACNSENKK